MPANSVIRLRRDTAAGWVSANPVLMLAEPGYETDTGKEKRGDGTTAWNSLPYFVPGSGVFVPLSTRPANVRNYGAAGDGSECATAIQSALSSGVSTVVIPKGSYQVTTPLVVPTGVTVVVETGARVWAGAAIRSVFESSTAFTRSNQFTGGGVIDAAEVADYCIFLRWFANVRVQALRLDNAKTAALKLGETGAGGRSAEAVVQGIHIYRHTNQIPASSNYGILVENSGDHSLSQVVIQSYKTGVFMASGTSMLNDVHVWHDPALGGVHDTSFEDNGSGNVYTNCYADTPASYGFRLRQFNNRVIGCTVFLNSTYGNDNTVRGVRFEQGSPFATVVDCFFVGGDASHRVAVDVEIVGADFTTMDMFGNQRSNVVSQNSAPRTRVITTRDLVMVDKGALPTASSSLRGQINVVRGGTGVADAAYICRKNASEAYEWALLTP